MFNGSFSEVLLKTFKIRVCIIILPNKENTIAQIASKNNVALIPTKYKYIVSEKNIVGVARALFPGWRVNEKRLRKNNKN